MTVLSVFFYLAGCRHLKKIFPLDRIVFCHVEEEEENTGEEKGKKNDRKEKGYNGHRGKSYKVNNLLSRETRLHLNIQLSLLSQSMKDVFISIPITSLRFISITRARSLEPANCNAKQCQWHFKGSQRVFDGILMLSGFFWDGGGDFRREHGELVALKSGNNDRTQLTPAYHQHHHAPHFSFFRVEITVHNMD